MRVAGVTTIKQANQYLAEEFAPWWNGTLTVQPANPDNAHRPLDKHHDLAAILSHMETRRVANDYTIQFESKVYQIASKDVRAGLRGGDVRVENAAMNRLRSASVTGKRSVHNALCLTDRVRRIVSRVYLKWPLAVASIKVKCGCEWTTCNKPSGPTSWYGFKPTTVH